MIVIVSMIIVVDVDVDGGGCGGYRRVRGRGDGRAQISECRFALPLSFQSLRSDLRAKQRGACLCGGVTRTRNKQDASLQLMEEASS